MKKFRYGAIAVVGIILMVMILLNEERYRQVTCEALGGKDDYLAEVGYVCV